MEFLAAQGYRLPGEDPLRRRFANCLQWFVSLNDVSTSRIDAIIQTVRETLVPASRMSGNHFTPAAHCGLQPQDGRNGEMGDVEKECCGKSGVYRKLFLGKAHGFFDS